MQVAQEKVRCLEQGVGSKNQQKLENTHEALASAADVIKGLHDRNKFLVERVQILEEEGESLKGSLNDCRRQVISSEKSILDARDECRMKVERCTQEHLKEQAALKLGAQEKVIDQITL